MVSPPNPDELLRAWQLHPRVPRSQSRPYLYLESMYVCMYISPLLGPSSTSGRLQQPGSPDAWRGTLLASPHACSPTPRDHSICSPHPFLNDLPFRVSTTTLPLGPLMSDMQLYLVLRILEESNSGNFTILALFNSSFAFLSPALVGISTYRRELALSCCVHHHVRDVVEVSCNFSLSKSFKSSHWWSRDGAVMSRKKKVHCVCSPNLQTPQSWKCRQS